MPEPSSTVTKVSAIRITRCFDIFFFNRIRYPKWIQRFTFPSHTLYFLLLSSNAIFPNYCLNPYLSPYFPRLISPFHIPYFIFHFSYSVSITYSIVNPTFTVSRSPFPLVYPTFGIPSPYLYSICYIEYSHVLHPQNEISFLEISHKSHRKSTPPRNKNCHPTKQNSLPANFP